MNINKVMNSKVGLAAFAVVVVGAVSYYAAKKAKETVNDIGSAINPINNDNVFNQGVLAVGQNLTGNKHWTLGGWIYDITH